MTKYIKYHKNYTEFGEPYQLVLPLNLEGLVPNDDSVRLLSHELEDLNYSLLYQAYSAKGRNPAVDPKTMFKILTYAYSQNIYSSREIETACKRDINFMWLLAGKKAPDHSTIARFRTGFLADACEDLFYQMVRRLEQMNELSKETVFIDGTKLEACVNKYTFVWKKSVGKWVEKMFLKTQEAVALLNREYLQSFSVSKETRTHDIQKICCFIEQVCEEQHTVFVHGRGKRKSRNQKYLELFRRFLERQTVYDWHTASFQGRNNYCKTDLDATFMHMKDDHMRNAQLKPGYNVQIGVDSEYIVAADIFQDRNDVWTLIPFLETIEKKVGFRYPSVTADSGYESEEAGKVKRFDNGIYFLPKKTIFKSGSQLAPEKVLECKYLRDKDKRCGYVSGLMFFNQMGLTTQIPMMYEVVSNKATNDYRETSLAKSRVIVRKPKVPITEKNYKVLQFLDMLKDVDVYSEVTGKQLQDRLYRYMDDANLSISEMEPYFSYYPDKLYKNLVETRVIYNGLLAQ